MEIKRLDLVTYLKENLGASTESDPAFNYTDPQLESVIEMAVKKRNPSYDLLSLPEGEEPLVLLLARKEIYWKLATSSAPFYPISAEGAKLNKNVRFEHYLLLIREVEEEYKNIIELGTNTILDDNNMGEILLDSRYYSRRNKNFANPPKIELKVDNTYSDKIEISWTLKDINKSRFKSYYIYISNSNIIDIYNMNKVSENATLIREIQDIHVTKYRISNLAPNTTYYIALEVEEMNSLKGFHEIQVITPLT